jgi:hypothetical protein
MVEFKTSSTGTYLSMTLMVDPFSLDTRTYIQDALLNLYIYMTFLSEPYGIVWNVTPWLGGL